LKQDEVIKNEQSGKAIAVCTRFQPVNIPQAVGTQITIPSLYGITASLKNVENDLKGLVNSQNAKPKTE
jgi:hypothetical protein